MFCLWLPFFLNLHNFSRIYAYDFNSRRKSRTYETIPEPHKALSSNKRSQTTLGRVIAIW